MGRLAFWVAAFLARVEGRESMKLRVIPVTPEHDEVCGLAATLSAVLRGNVATDWLFVELRRFAEGYYISAAPAGGAADMPRREMGSMGYDGPFVRASAEYRDALAKLSRELYDVLVMVTRDSGLSDVEAELATRAAIRAALSGACQAAEQYSESF